MNSIRRNMALRIGGAALLLSLGGGFGLYFALDGALATQFDHALATTVDWYRNNRTWWEPLKSRAALSPPRPRRS